MNGYGVTQSLLDEVAAVNMAQATKHAWEIAEDYNAAVAAADDVPEEVRPLMNVFWGLAGLLGTAGAAALFVWLFFFAEGC